MLHSLLRVDAMARDWVVTHRIAWLNGGLWLLSAMARGGLLFLAVAAIVALRRRRPWDVLVVAIAIVLASLLADHVLKPLLYRQRPFVTAPTVAVIGGRPQDPSLPSGHAANAFAGAVTLSRVVPEAAAIWWALAIAVAYSRVYLGVHYPGDVLAGAIVGLCSGLISLAIVDRVGRRRARVRWTRSG